MSREDFERSFTFTPASAPPVVNVLGPRLLMRGTFVFALLSAAAAMLPRSAAAAELLAVDTVSLRRAGKASSVSLLIDGSGFDAATSFSVVDSEGAVRAASKLQVLSTKQAIAAFNLSAAADGKAKLRAVRGGESAELTDAFDVEAGLSGKLVLHLESPGGLSPNETAVLIVQYANEGFADLEIPLLALSVPGAAYLGTAPQGANLGSSAVILGLGQRPLWTTLRPGERASSTLYVRVTGGSVPKLAAFSPADASLAGIVLDYTGIPGSTAGEQQELHTEFGANLREYYQKALAKLEGLILGGADSSYASVSNINGRWLFDYRAPDYALERPTLTGGQFALPPDTTPPVIPPAVPGSGDGAVRTWVVIIADAEYGALPLAVYFNPVQYGAEAGEILRALTIESAALDARRVHDLYHLFFAIPSAQITQLVDRPGDSFTLSAGAITSAIAALKTKSDGDDRIIIWFSGLAMTPEQGALYAPGTWQLNGGGVYTSEMLSTALDELTAAGKYVFVESGFSGAFVDRLTAKDTAAFASALSGQSTRDGDNGGGIFTQSMLAELSKSKSLFMSFSDTQDWLSEIGGGQHGATNSLGGNENGFPVTTTIYGTVRTETVVETATDAVTPDNVTKITETESSLGLFLPEDPLPYVPGGLAVCPWSHVIYVSDNTNGRLLMINPYETEHRAITLLEGLDHPGDVDIGCGGRSLVYTDGNRVKSMLFGFTVYLRGEDALPLRGAEVTVQTGLGQFIRKTDDRGYLTLLNLTDPSVYDNSVALTVKSGGKTQIYTFNLERSCHTFKALVFAGNGSVTPVFYQSGPYSHYKPPYGVCAGVEGEDPPAEKPEKKEIKQRIRTNKTVALQPIYTFRSEVATQPLVPPTIVLTSPADGQETSEAEQLIAGWVSDKSVTEVMIEINGTTYTIPVVGQRFAQNFTLGSGKSRISARASNVSGYAAQSEPVEVTVAPGSAVDSGGAVGQVVDSATGKGASDVVVTETASGRNAVTDASGYYSFAGLPAGEASFVVQ